MVFDFSKGEPEQFQHMYEEIAKRATKSLKKLNRKENFLQLCCCLSKLGAVAAGLTAVGGCVALLVLAGPLIAAAGTSQTNSEETITIKWQIDKSADLLCSLRENDAKRIRYVCVCCALLDLHAFIYRQIHEVHIHVGRLFTCVESSTRNIIRS